MTWVSDLASSLGLPAGAATLAAAMYAACAAAERAARPEALQDISYALCNRSWLSQDRFQSVIKSVFGWTFGEKHLSWKCLKRSLVGSAFFYMIVFLLLPTIFPYDSQAMSRALHLHPAVIFYDFIVVGCVSDYIALYKSRLLIARINASSVVALFILIDIFCSMLISASIIELSEIATPERYKVPMRDGILVPFLSTTMTSIWITLILLSTMVLKLLSPIQAFTAWFFDVKKHPIRAIGAVAGTLVMTGALVWSILKAVLEVV